jgi:hypothetical protein
MESLKRIQQLKEVEKMSDKISAKFILSLLFLSLLALNFVSADYVAGNSCWLNVTLLNQDPYPANPGDYVKVVFQVAGVGNSNCGGEMFELDPTYPFSIDNNESALRILEPLNYSSTYNTNWMIPYTLRVDPNALDGDTELNVVYHFKNWQPADYITQTFNVTIENTQTSFDAVIQEISGSQVSIAIANIGKYAANAVIVKIPEQDSFTAADVSGQMVGNLDSGDYTVVGFSLTQKGQMARNFTGTRNYPASGQPATLNSSSNQLKFDVYYTDNIGERRIVHMSLPLTLKATNSTLSGAVSGYPGAGFSRKSSSWSVWYTILIIVGVLGIIAFVLLKKFPKQTKAFFLKLKKKKEGQTNQIPDWIRNSKMNTLKEKEKK